jgi:hypothetical protein
MVDTPSRSAAARSLPGELLLLFIGPEEPSWTLLTLLLDRDGCTHPHFRWHQELAEAAGAVHQERFDCIIIDDVTAAPGAGGVAADLPGTIAALRAAGCDDPVLVLSDRADDAWLTRMSGIECELLQTRSSWRSTALVPWIHKAIERQTLVRERNELGALGRDRRRQDASETWRQLEQRRQAAVRLHPGRETEDREILDWALPSYHELLKSAVLAGMEQMQPESTQLLERLSAHGVTPAALLRLHVAAVESLLRGLGGRSAPHVLQQSDLVALEMIVRLSEYCAA